MLRCITPLALVTAVLATPAVAQDVNQTDNDWFTAGQARIQAELAKQANTNTAKNVILMIADGNGVGTNYATRLFMGQQEGGLGDDFVMPYEEFPNLALAKTYNVNAQTPDSAGTGTAMMSGVKTKAGIIGVNENVNRGDCSTLPGNELTSITEIMHGMGKSAGFVSTARVTHATPASVYAKTVDRNFEDDSQLPEGCDTQKDIATQLIDAMEAGLVSVAMGGGYRHFVPAGEELPVGGTGRRTDDINLIERATELGAYHAHNDETFANAPVDGTPLLGLFESSHMMYSADRYDEPSLADMAEAAVSSLSNDEDGFFLQVESGRVDHANHAGNLARVVTDGAAFAEAVERVISMVDLSETMVIVTADHEHALAFNGYCGRGSDILGLCMEIDGNGVEHTGEPLLGSDGKPYTVAGYLNGPGSVMTQQQDGNYFGTRPEVTEEQATDIDYIQQALVPRSSETHAGPDVAVYAIGPWSHLLNGSIEQNVVFHAMHYAATAE
ncbi:alkaline phosphatase [Halomonas sp. TBZ9]|uniref:Alkaline phosphatase n=1 Tax=Vreelandella azerica TaxID=2732867 RepID=A0A7Y3TWQ3_9GAMM|nr:alkaline phosphatase [Halomonas azerica]NOG31449.1 alkaline phosphatase [Halomonas azerica]